MKSHFSSLRGVPPAIWALGFGSLFMDASSELVHSLLPVFLVTSLGASMVTIGVIEGLAEATASFTKVFSGALSDYVGKRKFLVILGYGLSAATKPLFPLANSVSFVFLGRFMDRVGKGIRGAPRDALIADITPAHLRGTAFGLRQTLDSIGAFLGPLMAILLMGWFADDIRTVLWFGVIPAVIAVTLLAAAVREPERPGIGTTAPPALTLAVVRRLPRQYWRVVELGTVFTLARFSEAFLVLRAQDVGLAVGYVPAIMIAMNVVYAGVAYPAGVLSDRFSHRTMLVLGLAVLVVADLLLASATGPGVVFVGTAVWGLHMGLTQGLLSKLVADTAPAHLRGTAFGVFNLVSGVALLLASVIAGALWSAVGPSGTFMTGAAFALLAMIGLTRLGPAASASPAASR